MVDYKGQVRNASDEFFDNGKVTRTQQKIVRDFSPLQFFQPAEHVLTKQPAIVRLIVHQVSHAFELRMLAAVEYFTASFIGQVHPPDYAENEAVLRRNFQQPVSLTRIGGRLHRNGSIESVPRKNRSQIRREKIAPERTWTVRHPRIFEPGQIPEVLMRVDTHENISLSR